MEALNTHSNLSREKAFSTCEDFVELYNTAPPLPCTAKAVTPQMVHGPREEEPVSSSLLSALLDHIWSIATSLSQLICPVASLEGRLPSVPALQGSQLLMAGLFTVNPLAHV